MERIWITGRGVLCPLGNTPEALADALEQCSSAVRPLAGPAAMGFTPYGCVGAPLPGEPATEALFDPAWPALLTALLDRTSVLALRAAQSAWADAGLAADRFDTERAGVAWGSGMGARPPWNRPMATCSRRCRGGCTRSPWCGPCTTPARRTSGCS